MYILMHGNHQVAADQKWSAVFLCFFLSGIFTLRQIVAK